MSHHMPKTGYRQLVDRLNRFPQGAFPSPLLYDILALLVSEREAELVSRLPLMPFTAKRAAGVWLMTESKARTLLDGLAYRALLLDLTKGDETFYVLPPPMAGFFEFALMRVRTDIDQQALSELFYQYLNVEEDFIRDLFVRGETKLGRIFVHEPALSSENASHVLEYERASEVIRTAQRIGVGRCYCRHKMSHVGKACSAPQEICMTFNLVAEPLIRHGHARQAGSREALDLLQQARDRQLVQFGDNVREGVNFICHCCRCCCDALLAAKRFANLHPVHTTNFAPIVQAEQCMACGRCAAACPVEAMQHTATTGIERTGINTPQIDMDRCLGCGLCVKACRFGALILESRAKRVLTPVNTAHRVVLMAIERNCLQNLIFDNQALRSHRAMAAILGVILRLPPLKQYLASKQMNSHYLERLLQSVHLPAGIR
ncbi:4Fe-4S dicluster domain-containing protein [Geomobilimonas luticola]|uniref:4Fe-4S binding protein n=1 Tax=Geomobilimonas luticola TaxID=1114878 RepID=A0ABS5SIQ8_9BACT|nr:4Fe-4S binding protein [Geomobilimonas luticola]MBT0654644.1 4Fe-4S binding protein [Geomobilimonas luticola]